MAGRSVRRFIEGLGYRVHTPAEVFGRDRLDAGLHDEDWLPVVGAQGWAVFGRDQRILSLEHELRAYLDARIHMFLLPGTATRERILELVGLNLNEICTVAAARRPGVYWLTPAGLTDLPRRQAARSRRRGRSS